jgi:phospholipid transport system substrate-binding protein
MTLFLRSIFTTFVLFYTTSSFALDKTNIKSYMSESINKVTYILKQKDKTKHEKSEEIFNLLDNIFDYKLMSRISLGRYYKKLSKQEKIDFQIAFKNKLKSSYMDKLNLYTNQDTNIKNLKEVKNNRIILYTDLIGDDSVFAINYKFYANKQNQWLIYDVELLGVSIIQTYRKQFKEYLSEHSIAELTKNM